MNGGNADEEFEENNYGTMLINDDDTKNDAIYSGDESDGGGDVYGNDMYGTMLINEGNGMENVLHIIYRTRIYVCYIKDVSINFLDTCLIHL